MLISRAALPSSFGNRGSPRVHFRQNRAYLAGWTTKGHPTFPSFRFSFGRSVRYWSRSHVLIVWGHHLRIPGWASGVGIAEERVSHEQAFSRNCSTEGTIQGRLSVPRDECSP